MKNLELFINSIKNFFSKYNIYLNIVLLIIGITGFILFIFELGKSSSNEVITKASEEEIYSQNSETIEPQYVDIEGQIVNPGVYEIFRADTLIAIIDRAGGYRDEADIQYVQKCLNLAEKLKDEQKIYIPAKIENFSCNNNILSISDNQDDNDKISINKSTSEELDTLPGIGPSIAQKIIDGRPYSTIEELLNVEGIGEKTLEKLKPYITL